jgi:hypothetical protein
MKWRTAWERTMTAMGMPDTEAARGGTNASNSGPVANAYFARWRSDPAKSSADSFIEAHWDEIAAAVE